MSDRPRTSWCREATTSGVLSLQRETKFIIGFDFAVTLSSPEFFRLLFDITSEQLVELKWLMLNKHKRWFHSSRVKIFLVGMSASWFLVSTCLIWIFGSKLILSKNQSKATLWVLDTCLMFGLPLMIILITASLSSKLYNWSIPWENCALVVTWSTHDNWSTSQVKLLFGFRCVLQTVTCLASVPRCCGIGWWFGFVCWWQYFNHHIP